MDEEDRNQKEIALFVRIGILVLSIVVLISLAVKYLPSAITVSNTGSKIDLPIYCVNTEDNKVALTFDAVGGNEDTSKILNILAKHNVKVTFFVSGEWVKQHPNDVKAIAEGGHELGNYGENHKIMTKLNKKQCADEIMKLHNRVKKLTGIEMNLFRAPYGHFNNDLVGTVRDLDYYSIQWDVDSEDWKDYGVDNIIKSVVDNKHLGNGSIILMHNGAKYTPEALEAIIKSINEKGYRIVPISKLIYTGEYKIDSAGRQYTK